MIVRNDVLNKEDDSVVNIGMVKTSKGIVNLNIEATPYCNIGRYLNSSTSASSKKKNCEIRLGII